MTFQAVVSDANDAVGTFLQSCVLVCFHVTFLQCQFSAFVLTAMGLNGSPWARSVPIRQPACCGLALSFLFMIDGGTAAGWRLQ